MSDPALLLYTILHVALIAAPGVAAVLFAGARGARDVVVLLAIGLVISGAAAMLAFWAYFAVHDLGVVLSFAVPGASVAVGIWSAVRIRGEFPWALVGWPLALWALGTIFIVCLGFLHGGASQPLATSATRFSHPLPVDNYLPAFFAEGTYKLGHFRVPAPLADWISSDRPPLQSGYVLAARPWGWPTSEIRYQILGVALQQLWIIGIWALLVGARVRRHTRGLVMVGLLVSDVIIVNGFYVWPKLIATGFLLAAAAIVLTDRWSTARLRLGWGALAGGLLALAMLCHGSSIYAAFPLAIVALIRARPSWRFVGALVLAGAVLYVPWMAYQHWADPPGNRLTNWMLAGDSAVHTKPTSQAIIDAYSEAGVGESIENKVDNLGTIAGGAQGIADVGHAARLAVDGDWNAAIAAVRYVRFFSLVQSLGVFLLAPIVIVVLWRRRRDRADWLFTVRGATVVGIGVALWALLQFGNELSLAWLHVGSYAIPLLAMAVCITGVAALSTRAAVVLVALNVASALVLYTPTLAPPPGTERFSGVLLVVGLVALGAFAVIGLRRPRGGQDATKLPGRSQRARARMTE